MNIDHFIGWCVGIGMTCLFAVGLANTVKPQPKQCPGEVVSMVIDKDGTVLCTYMLVPQGVVTKKEKQK